MAGCQKGSIFMKTLSSSRICLAAVMGLLMACSSTKKDVAQAPRSNDLLELLTGFGESLSKRNFAKAVDYMVPEEKALMMEGGSVPTDKQKMLLALRLQTLIRHPAIRVQDGHIAGIYSVLPNLRQGDANPMAASEENLSPDAASADVDALASESKGPMGTPPADASAAAASEDESAAAPLATNNPNDPQLKATVNKFFSAVNKKNWSSALAMMNDGEKKLLLDDRGRIKESSKQRLAQIDQKNREALILQDGKLTGVTLLLPSD
ncbi:MAG: hypothetical protein JWO30_2292 [Fibrobacteres bacterium]|nr:hypothetical protein [Fibrobacterota bacterium]